MQERVHAAAPAAENKQMSPADNTASESMQGTPISEVLDPERPPVANQ